jgi:hypothetical protein
MTNDEIAKHISNLRLRQNRITKAIQEKTELLAATNADLCKILCDASARLSEGGHIGAGAHALATEPKEP